MNTDMQNVSPMLLTEGKPFDSQDFIFELKFDGIRCVAYLSETTVLRNKRNKDVTAVYPELKGIHKSVARPCILDGEVLCMVDGKVDFSCVQKRALASNPIKIDFLSQQMPVQFVAYDILYLDGEDLTGKDLMYRKNLLEQTVVNSRQLSVSRYIETNGKAFFELAKKQGLEGIVAKRKNSVYVPGKRSTDWLKIKALLETDFVICGYNMQNHTVKHLVLGLYDGGKLVYGGKVYLGTSKAQQALIVNYAKMHASPPHFDADPDTVWMKPHLVCTVKYMQLTANGHMRQPFFKGLRDDKKPAECTVSQFL